MGAIKPAHATLSISDRLKQCLVTIGLDASRYSGGLAQFAFQCGLPIDLIKLQGDWLSNACNCYLEPSFELGQQVGRFYGVVCRHKFVLLALVLSHMSVYIKP